MTLTTPGDTPATYSPATTLTLSEIADLTGRDLKTIKTWNDSGNGRWPNATQDEAGRKTWRVPVRDLVATGGLPARPRRTLWAPWVSATQLRIEFS